MERENQVREEAGQFQKQVKEDLNHQRTKELERRKNMDDLEKQDGK